MSAVYQMGVTMTPEQETLVEKIQGEHGVTRHAVMIAAVRLGLALAATDPSMLDSLLPGMTRGMRLGAKKRPSASRPAPQAAPTPEVPSTLPAPPSASQEEPEAPSKDVWETVEGMFK